MWFRFHWLFSSSSIIGDDDIFIDEDAFFSLLFFIFRWYFFHIFLFDVITLSVTADVCSRWVSMMIASIFFFSLINISASIFQYFLWYCFLMWIFRFLYFRFFFLSIFAIIFRLFSMRWFSSITFADIFLRWLMWGSISSFFWYADDFDLIKIDAVAFWWDFSIDFCRISTFRRCGIDWFLFDCQASSRGAADFFEAL